MSQPPEPVVPEWVGSQRTKPWEFLDRWERASVAVDCVVLTVQHEQLHLLVLRRDNQPALDEWALPGAFVNHGETLDEAVRRCLKQKVRLDPEVPMHQFTALNDPVRDERGWVLSVVFCGLAPLGQLKPHVVGSPDRLALAPLNCPPGDGLAPDDLDVDLDGQEALALRHVELVAAALQWLRQQVRVAPVALSALPEAFTLRQFQVATEAVLGEPVNKDSFRRSVTRTNGWVQPTGRYQQVSGRQAAELYEAAG